jgi:hypothetical protein
VIDPVGGTGAARAATEIARAMMGYPAAQGAGSPVTLAPRARGCPCAGINRLPKPESWPALQELV